MAPASAGAVNRAQWTWHSPRRTRSTDLGRELTGCPAIAGRTAIRLRDLQPVQRVRAGRGDREIQVVPTAGHHPPAVDPGAGALPPGPLRTDSPPCTERG